MAHTGISKRLKEVYQDITVIGVQPAGCDILNGVFVKHKIQAITTGKLGSFVDKSLINEMFSVDYNAMLEIKDYLAHKQGLFVGLSSLANIYAACKIALRYNESQNIVTIAPDSGRSYF